MAIHELAAAPEAATPSASAEAAGGAGWRRHRVRAELEVVLVYILERAFGLPLEDRLDLGPLLVFAAAGDGHDFRYRGAQLVGAHVGNVRTITGASSKR